MIALTLFAAVLVVISLAVGFAIAVLVGALAAFCAIGLYGIHLDVADVARRPR